MGVLERARTLGPVLRERALEGEAARTLPSDLVEQLRAAGLFHLGMPRALGGPPCDPPTIVEVIEQLALADGSAAWTVFTGNSTAFLAWLDPAVASELWARRSDAVVASVFAPTGQAVPDGEGGFTVGGRWAFASGAPHADWFVNGVVVIEGDGPKVLESGRPDWRFAFVPAERAQVLDTWHAAGLRGTGSHDVVVEGERVPVEHTIAPLFEPARADDDLFRLPFFTLLLVFGAGFPLGVARRALDELLAIAPTKSRRSGGEPLAEDEAVQVEVARLDGALRSSRSFVFDAIGQVWDTVRAGDRPTVGQRAQVLSSVLQAFRTGVTVVDASFHLCGASAVYESHPLQRCLRDLHVASQHILVSIGSEKAVGRVLLGLEPGSILL